MQTEPRPSKPAATRKPFRWQKVVQLLVIISTPLIDVIACNAANAANIAHSSPSTFDASS